MYKRQAVVHDVAREAARRHFDTVQRRGLGPGPSEGAPVAILGSGRGSEQEAEENYHRGAALGGCVDDWCVKIVKIDAD